MKTIPSIFAVMMLAISVPAQSGSGAGSVAPSAPPSADNNGASQLPPNSSPTPGNGNSEGQPIYNNPGGVVGTVPQDTAAPEVAATNAPAMAPTSNETAAVTNQAPVDNTIVSVTNRLSTMAPAQAQTVMQVQQSVNVLQQIAVNINVSQGQSVQQIVLQNPRAQQQIQQVTTQIIGLARGVTRPSYDGCDRLSFDLVRVCGRVHLAREHQLVLAILINDACNCEKLTAAQFSAAVNNGIIILRNAGVPLAYCNAFSCDLHSIALEVNPNLEI